MEYLAHTAVVILRTTHIVDLVRRNNNKKHSKGTCNGRKTDEKTDRKSYVLWHWMIKCWMSDDVNPITVSFLCIFPWWFSLFFSLRKKYENCWIVFFFMNQSNMKIFQVWHNIFIKWLTNPIQNCIANAFAQIVESSFFYIWNCIICIYTYMILCPYLLDAILSDSSNIRYLKMLVIPIGLAFLS